MFNCGICGVATGPRVRPVLVVQDTRPMSYLNHGHDEEGEPREVRSQGFETIREVQACPSCVGADVEADQLIDIKAFVLLAESMHKHAKGCKKPLDDCSLCQKQIAQFATFPLPALSVALTH